MNLAHARALLAGCIVHVENEDAVGQRTWLLALARWAARRWSPVVSVDGTDGLLLDTTGCGHLFGGEARLITAIERGVRALGLTPRIGAAGTIGTAWAAARFGSAQHRMVCSGREREALAPLPTPALRIDPDSVDALAEVGIDRIGQLLDVPRHSLPIRYGPDLLRRIDQALGRLPEAVQRTTEKPVFLATRELPGGTTHLESIELVVKVLLDQIAGLLARQESGLRRLDGTFDRLGGEPEHLSIQVTRATRDPRHLWSLLRPKVERLNMGYGLERITLRAVVVAPLPHRQATIAGGDNPTWQDDADFAAMLDALASRLGRTRVLRPELVPSYRPERSCRLVPVDEAATPLDPAPSFPTDPRPSRLLDPPSPAETIALTPDGPILRLRWRGHEHRLLCSIGPERIAPEWWRAREPVRDYFRVQNDRGRWLWLFREVGAPKWFVHGEWN